MEDFNADPTVCMGKGVLGSSHESADLLPEALILTNYLFLVLRKFGAPYKDVLDRARI